MVGGRLERNTSRTRHESGLQWASPCLLFFRLGPPAIMDEPLRSISVECRLCLSRHLSLRALRACDPFSGRTLQSWVLSALSVRDHHSFLLPTYPSSVPLLSSPSDTSECTSGAPDSACCARTSPPRLYDCGSCVTYLRLVGGCPITAVARAGVGGCGSRGREPRAVGLADAAGQGSATQLWRNGHSYCIQWIC